MKILYLQGFLVTVASVFPTKVQAFTPHAPKAILKRTIHTNYNWSKLSSNGKDNDGETKSWTSQIGDAFNMGKIALVKSQAGEYDTAAVRAKLTGLIEDEPVLMLSFVKWPFCIKAKALLDAKGAKYTVIELDEAVDGKAIRAELGEMMGRTSVPAIWIGGQFVGGCNDGPMGGVMKLNETDKLDVLLKGVSSI